MNQTKAYQMLVFDWDGTLVDSIGRIVDCFQLSFRRLGLPEPEPAAIAQLVGLPLVDSFRILDPRISREQDQALEDTYREIWRSDLLPVSAIFPGVREMLQELEGQGYQMAIATGKSREGLQRELSYHRLERHFPYSRCAGEGPAKPNPTILQEIMALGKVAPQKTLMIGDTTMDLEMANNAGAIPVAVTSGGHSESQLKSSNPLACLARVTDLWQVLTRQG